MQGYESKKLAEVMKINLQQCCIWRVIHNTYNSCNDLVYSILYLWALFLEAHAIRSQIMPTGGEEAGTGAKKAVPMVQCRRHTAATTTACFTAMLAVERGQ